MSQTVLPNTAGVQISSVRKRRRSERSASASVRNDGSDSGKIPTEVLVTDRREFELAEEVLSPLPCVKTLIMQPFSLQTGTKTEALSGQRRRNQL